MLGQIGQFILVIAMSAVIIGVLAPPLKRAIDKVDQLPRK